MIPVYDASENYNLIKLRNIRPGLTLKFILEEVPSLLFFFGITKPLFFCRVRVILAAICQREAKHNNPIDSKP